MDNRNRPYTLVELLELPKGGKVWVESSPGIRAVLKQFAISGWHTKRGGEIQTARGNGFQIDNPATNYHWRAWPAPPTEDEAAAWPWEEDGHAQDD